MQGRFLVAGTNSGCGKTTVCMALLAALKKRGAGLNAFKCGPDYIDPMFHRAVLGVPSYNLDPYFC
ncbi:MAG: cobyrinate a,c-diamide synthase, partial [Firmicutes bacterium]|nr:cobyrinate a,c-diamide synthase [Bacillota bacterium]